VKGWDAAAVEQLPPEVRALFGDPNTRHWNFHGGNKPANMARDAPGIDPSRWER
jgi:hypothetical protein